MMRPKKAKVDLTIIYIYIRSFGTLYVLLNTSKYRVVCNKSFLEKSHLPQKYKNRFFFLWSSIQYKSLLKNWPNKIIHYSAN